MKQKLIVISALLFAILSRVNGQNQFGDYVNWLKDNDNRVEGIIKMDDPKIIKRNEYYLFPKPISVKKHSSKVIVVFDRKEWDRVQYLQRKKWLHNSEVKKQVQWLKDRKEIKKW